jgi:hypothetical protein
VDTFVRDKSPKAYEALIDRLLASAHYGERWGRHWLDLARYADTSGFHNDLDRPYAWKYRDYVIRAMNDDKPWNEFIQEQIAGDELASATHGDYQQAVLDPKRTDQLIATAFLRMAPDGTGDTVDDPKLAKNQVIAEQIRVLSSSLMGMTVACAQCHDHRYDPITQADYYRLRAIFDPAFHWEAWRNPAQRLYSLYSPQERAKAAESELADARGRLAQSQAVGSDEQVASVAAADAAARDTADEQLAALTAEYQAGNPDDVAAELAAAIRAERDIAGELAAADKEIDALTAQWEIIGAEGRQGQLDDAEAALRRIGAEHDAVRDRAEAAKFLRTTMIKHRENIQQRYVEPFRTELERLGRIVFQNESVKLDINPDLSIESRTLDGRTVPYGSLSTGTREQLAIMVRLTGAAMVADADTVRPRVAAAWALRHWPSGGRAPPSEAERDALYARAPASADSESEVEADADIRL